MFCFAFCSGFSFWKKMTKLISSWSCLIRAFSFEKFLKRGGELRWCNIGRRERKVFFSFLPPVWEIKFNSNCTLYR